MKPKVFTSEWILCIALLILLLSLSSCKPEAPEPPIVYANVCGDGVCSAKELGTCNVDCDTSLEVEPVVKTPADVLADLRSRIRNYTPEERLNFTNTYVNNDNKIFVESFTSYLPETGFMIASRYNLLSIGENLSSVIGELNKFHLREVLREGSVRSSTEAFGPRAALYEQFLKLRAGKVVFGYDDEADVVSTYLLFKEEEPILDYSFELTGGIFKFFEGEKIHFLGHEYILEEVSNTSLKLVGVTTPDELIFRNGRGVMVNGNTLSENDLNVTLKKDSLRVIILASEDIRIHEGRGLRSYMKRPEALLTNRLDIVYEGLSQVPVFDIKFDKMSSKYKLLFTTNKNITYNLPLAYLSPLKLGDDKSSLVYKEGMNKTDYVIKTKDYFIISNNKQLNGLTNIIRLMSIEDEDNVLVFEDPALEKFAVYFEGEPGVNATADLIVDRVVHKVYVGKEGIAVDLDGNGRISQDNVPIITAGNGIIKINSAYHDAINVSVITPKEMRENNKTTSLEINVIIKDYGISVSKDDLELIYDPSTNSMLGMTDYGALFVVKSNIDEDYQSGEDLIIKYPLVQRFADVIVKAYE